MKEAGAPGGGIVRRLQPIQERRMRSEREAATMPRSGSKRAGSGQTRGDNRLEIDGIKHEKRKTTF